MLLTGFQGYGGRDDNPAARVAMALAGERFGSEIVHAHTLPVTNHNLYENLQTLIERHQPSLVISLGLAPGESMIRLERLAANFSKFEIADNAGDFYVGPVVAAATAAYESTLPLDAMCQAILQRGIPARISQTAGTFLCNAIMYHALHISEKVGASFRSGFIHLPYMPSQVSDLMRFKGQGEIGELHQRADLSSMALNMQIDAVRLAIEQAINHRSDSE